MRLLMVLLILPAAFACVVPTNSMEITKSTTFCSDVYYVNNGIKITQSDVTLTCEGTVLKSWRGGRGIVIENANNITIQGCRVMNYNIGIVVSNASRVLLDDNHLIRNQIGVRLLDVSESATYNHDVSLNMPIDIVRSTGNIISATNKPLHESFCETNFCNKERSTVEHFMTPKLTPNQMQNWLSGQVGKSKQRLFEWVFGGLF